MGGDTGDSTRGALWQDRMGQAQLHRLRAGEGRRLSSIYLHLRMTDEGEPIGLPLSVTGARGLASALMSLAAQIEAESAQRCACGEPIEAEAQCCDVCEISRRRRLRSEMRLIAGGAA